MRLKFVDYLLEEAETVTDKELAYVAKIHKPPVFSYGMVGRVLPKDLQKVAAIVSRRAERYMKAAERVAMMSRVTGRNQKVSLLREAAVLKEKFEEAESFFTAAVRAELNIKETGAIGICTGWTVYLTDPFCPSCQRRHPKEEARFETGNYVGPYSGSRGDLEDVMGLLDLATLMGEENPEAIAGDLLGLAFAEEIARGLMPTYGKKPEGSAFKVYGDKHMLSFDPMAEILGLLERMRPAVPPRRLNAGQKNAVAALADAIIGNGDPLR